jgi:hypothetical protein
MSCCRRDTTFLSKGLQLTFLNRNYLWKKVKLFKDEKLKKAGLVLVILRQLKWIRLGWFFLFLIL